MLSVRFRTACWGHCRYQNIIIIMIILLLIILIIQSCGRWGIFREKDPSKFQRLKSIKIINGKFT